MSDMTYPHVRAAFINALREEGTTAEACNYLQLEWNKSCAQARQIANLQGMNIAQAAELTRLRARIEAADRLAEAVREYLRIENLDTGIVETALSAYEAHKGGSGHG